MRNNKNNTRQGMKRIVPGALVLAVAASVAPSSEAGEPINFDDGAQLDWSVITTYGIGMRMRSPDAKLISDPNADDGDRNFDRHSLVSNRLTALGELIYQKDNYGAVLRGSVFYDDVYHRENDNDSPATVNKDGAHDHFTSDAEKYAGGRARFLDAYGFADFDLPDEQRLNVKAGRHVVAWGESVFYPGVNGVQGRVDVVNADLPGIEVKDILLPIGQVSANWEINPAFGLSAYVQYEWKGNELNPPGSYLSTSDVTGPGREKLLIPGLGEVRYGGTDDPRSSGQYGVRAMYRPLPATEFGLFHVRYHDRNPATFSFDETFEHYRIEYFEDIKLTGMSFSTSVGDTQVGGEWSYRTGVPIQLESGDVTRGSGQQMQVSFMHALGDMPWASSTIFVGELVHVQADDVDRVNGSKDFTFKNDEGWQTRSSTAYTLVTSLSYPGISPGWDLDVPLNWSHVVSGNTPIRGTLSGGKGDKRLSLGTSFTYQGRLQLETTYTAFLGSADPTRGRDMTDRDFLSFSAKYSF